MLPIRKNSKGFRQRKIPNIQTDIKQRIMRECGAYAPFLHQTQTLKSNKPSFERTDENQGQTNKNVLRVDKKFSLENMTLNMITAKMQPARRVSNLNEAKKQKHQFRPRRNTTDKTIDSTQNSFDKSIQISEKVNKIARKTELADQILKQIQDSMGDTKRSMSAMSKTRKDEKKKIVETCKVLKVPWKSSKTGFHPQVSMIHKKSSGVQANSLRQICDNLQ